MRTVLNVVWLLLAGLWLAAAYALAGFILCVTIVGIPFGLQAFKLAAYALWPFGHALIPSADRDRELSAVGNVLWFVLAGWWLALAHLLVGLALCVTIIGIPLGLASFKMAGAALAPFGKDIVDLRSLGEPPPGSIVVPADRVRRTPPNSA